MIFFVILMDRLNSHYKIIKKHEGSDILIGFIRNLANDKWIIDFYESPGDKIFNKFLKELREEYYLSYMSTIQMELRQNGSYYIDASDPPFLLNYEYIPISGDNDSDNFVNDYDSDESINDHNSDESNGDTYGDPDFDYNVYG
jgi:hypothetical protein